MGILTYHPFLRSELLPYIFLCVIASPVTPIFVEAAIKPPSWACEAAPSAHVYPSSAHVYPAGAGLACADDSCGPQQTLLEGELRVIAYDTLHDPFSRYHPPSEREYLGDDPVECCEACKRQEFCNVWVECNRVQGCGAKGSCSQYLKATGGVQSTPPGWEGSWVFPVAKIGPWGRGFPTCNRDGTWPMGTCTLKLLATGTNNSSRSSNNSKAEGWISGLIPSKAKPALAGCPVGVTKDTCMACLGSKDPSLCFACAKNFGSPLVCATCASLSTMALRDKCMDVSTKEDAPMTGSFLSRESYVRCVKTGAPVDTEKCFMCIEQTGEVNACTRCLNSPVGTEKCFMCIEQTREIEACTECLYTGLSSAAYVNMDRCLACIKDVKQSPNKAARLACGVCNDALVKDPVGCLACAAKGAHKKACAGCSTDIMSPWTKQCYDCLAKGVVDGYCAQPVPGSIGVDPVPKELAPYMLDYFQCLETGPRHHSTGFLCWDCFHHCPDAGKAAVQSCFACQKRMFPVQTNGTNKAYYCPDCYCGTGKVKAHNPAACEACVKHTTKGDEDQCVKAP